jgi:hypothetical protein
MELFILVTAGEGKVRTDGFMTSKEEREEEKGRFDGGGEIGFENGEVGESIIVGAEDKERLISEGANVKC